MANDKGIISTISKWVREHTPETIVMVVIVLGIAAYLLIKPYTHVSYEPTTAYIADSVRHYPPIIRGGKVYVSCKIVNTGSQSLVITDIQPANFSIEQISPDPKLIAAHDTAVVSFVFTTDKIVGYTQQKIRFYGNIKDTGMLEVTFDTHVVRPAGDESDYEDIYFREKQDITDIIVDGEMGEKGYTVDTLKDVINRTRLKKKK